MQIDSIRLVHVARPLAAPELFGQRELTRHESVLVELQSGEHSAWGEADPGSAPGDSAEWAGGALLCLKDWLAPALIGQDVTSGQVLQDHLRHVAGNQAAKAALDIAWWNLEACRQNV
jgi:O-succinylbenzoate synthase